MAKMKYYRFYLEDVTNGNVFTHIFSATSKAKAIELLNEYGSGIETISIKIVTPELMKRYGLTNESNSYNSPVETFEPSDDVSEIAEPETPAPAETPEQSDDVPEVSEPATPVPDETPEQSDDVPEIAEPETSSSLETIISEIPFDLKIKPLCRKCKLLGSCYDKHPSKVLEDVYSGEHCDDVCGDCTLCCSDYKPLISFPETPVIKYYVYINSMKGNRFELVDCATLHKAYIRFILLLHSFSSLQRNSIYVAYICDESDEILGFIRRDNRGFFFKPLKSDNVPETSVELSDFYDDVPF